jgi:hypothetical protein
MLVRATHGVVIPKCWSQNQKIRKPFSIIGSGYIKTAVPTMGINWNKVQRKAIKKGWEHGADVVLILQKNVVNPLPAFQAFGSMDSVGGSVRTYSHGEAYYPVSTWHDILFLKYK